MLYFAHIYVQLSNSKFQRHSSEPACFSVWSVILDHTRSLIPDYPDQLVLISLSLSQSYIWGSLSVNCYLSASVFAWIAFMLSQIEHILIVNLAFGSPFDRGGHICIEFVDNCFEFSFRRTIIWRCTPRKANLTNCWSVDASNQIHRWAVVRFTTICTFLLLRRTWLHPTRKFL